MGIEPTLSAWKAEVLPLNYARLRVQALNYARLRVQALNYARLRVRASNYAGVRVRRAVFARFGGTSTYRERIRRRSRGFCAARSSDLWWGEADSNRRRLKPPDLQSGPVGRFGISPCSRGSVQTQRASARVRRARRWRLLPCHPKGVSLPWNGANRSSREPFAALRRERVAKRPAGSEPWSVSSCRVEPAVGVEPTTT